MSFPKRPTESRTADDAAPDPAIAPPHGKLEIFVRGLLMGGADVIPGVSGGTVALIVGIYHRLVLAISHLDVTFLKHCRRRQWRLAARHCDLAFLATLAAGIVSGIVALGGMMHRLLEEGTVARPLTLSVFFGAIAASSLLVAGMAHPRGRRESLLCIALGLAGAAGAYRLTDPELIAPASDSPSAWYLFACGVVAICAMILPGISGAYVLSVLGVYKYLTGILDRLLRLDSTASDAAHLALFASACGLGLLAFSKVLRLLLSRFQAVTMATLCGIMVGAIRIMWPFPEIPVGSRFVDAGCVALLLASAALVLALDWWTRGHRRPLTRTEPPAG